MESVCICGARESRRPRCSARETGAGAHFEQTASTACASALETSQPHTSIVFYKGAMVFRMLRETIGRENFDKLLAAYLETYRGKNASIDDFEKLATKISQDNLRYFFAQWVEGTGVPEFTVDYQIIRTRAGKFRTRGTVKQNSHVDAVDCVRARRNHRRSAH